MDERGLYATLDELRTRIRTPDTDDDALLLGHLETASRAIDDFCRRHFYVVTDTRYYSPSLSDRFTCPDDILSVTTLKTDKDNDRTWGYTWAASDYELHPLNKWPKWQIKRRPDGDYSFLIGDSRLQLVGLFGYGDGQSATPYKASGATLTLSDAADTSAVVSSATPFSAGQTLLVESEQIYVESKAGTTLTVARAVNGTTAAAHSAKAASIYQYPRQVRDVCLGKAAKLYRKGDSPGGVAGPSEYGPSQIRIYVDLDTDEKRLLARFRKAAVA